MENTNNEASAGQPTILIVDDDLIVRKMLTRIISKTYPNAKVVDASDGFEAGEQMNHQRPSLIILDVHMPGDSGLDVCSRIRQDPSMKNVNILMVTGDHQADLKNLSFKAGADAFLIKPFEDLSFLKVISQLLQRHLVKTDDER